MDQNSPQKNQTPNNTDNFGIAGKPLVPTLDAQGHAFDALQASNEIPKPAQKSDIQDDIHDLHNESIIPNLRTYESDVADVVKHKNTSVVKIVVQEQKREEAQPERKKVSATPIIGNTFIVIVSFFLIASGMTALGLLAFYKLYVPTVAATHPTPVKSNIITTEASVNIPLQDGATIDSIIQSHSQSITGPAGSLLEVVFTTGTSTTQVAAETFANRIGTQMPSWLSRSFSPVFMSGYHMLSTPQPFLIFKTNSYENAFAGMLKWEDSLRNDFGSLSIHTTPVIDPTATSTNMATSSIQNVASPLGFQDMVISNKDVRTLNDVTGVPIVMYSLPDKNTIVITTNEKTMKEIFARMSTSQFVQ